MAGRFLKRLLKPWYGHNLGLGVRTYNVGMHGDTPGSGTAVANESDGRQGEDLDLGIVVERTEYQADITRQSDGRDFGVRWCAREVLMPAGLITTTNTPYGILKFTVAGRGRFTSDGVEWELNPGTIFWQMPSIESRLEAEGEEPLINYVVMTLGRDHVDLLEAKLHTPVGADPLRRPAQVGRVIDLIIRQSREPAAHMEENCADLARVLLREIDANLTTGIRANPVAHATFRACKQYIHDHFAEITSLRQVAEACKVTVPYLCRLFDVFEDRTPYDHLTSLKLSRAEYLLLGPKMSVRQIANAVGYRDPRLFARNFKATYGCSPSSYRRAFC